MEQMPNNRRWTSCGVHLRQPGSNSQMAISQVSALGTLRLDPRAFRKQCTAKPPKQPKKNDGTSSTLATIRQRSRIAFSWRGARPSGVVAGSDTGKGEFDRKCVERSGTVLARPFLEMGMAWMATVLSSGSRNDFPAFTTGLTSVTVFAASPLTCDAN